MAYRIYQVDSFCKDLFSGNPAAVCPLENWLEDQTMKNIAAENNLAETTFYVKEKGGFRIRWFTPEMEIDLCGHATLAAAHVLFTHEGFVGNAISLASCSGELKVSKKGDQLTLDFPADQIKQVEVTADMLQWFSAKPIEAYKGRSDYMLVFRSEAEVAGIRADLAVIGSLTGCRGVIITAKGDTVDFVSRFFAPQIGIPEDQVTGSAHTTLTPYWSQRLLQSEFEAIQLSPRKGYLHCKHAGERIEISGQAKTYMIGEIFLK
ncbi:MAG TPA: PhzF family phenazine biosynthesis protein [Puia sp.]|jgi:PhzF family phenazine biosynthesis protein|nr:PhzF family phenazine biosynthesis protein [Puia sp.]